MKYHQDEINGNASFASGHYETAYVWYRTALEGRQEARQANNPDPGHDFAIQIVRGKMAECIRMRALHQPSPPAQVVPGPGAFPALPAHGAAPQA